MPFDLGGTVTLTCNLTDTSGAPANGGTVTVTVTQPDGTTAGPFTVTPAGTGQYSYLFTPTLPGRHLARWLSTGANTGAMTEAFDVVDVDPGYLVSLEDVKAFLNMSSTRNDAELRMFIEAATDLVEQQVGPTVIRSHTEVLPAADVIVLAKAPVVALTSIAATMPYYYGGLVFNPSQYLLDGPAGILRRQALYPFVGDWTTNWDGPWYGTSGLPLTITYTAGRAVIPAAMRLACLIIIGHLWETQRAAMPNVMQGEPTDPVPGIGYAVPDRAVELLAPYARSRGFD